MSYRLEVWNSDGDEIYADLLYTSNIAIRREISGPHTLRFTLPLTESGWNHLDESGTERTISEDDIVRVRDDDDACVAKIASADSGTKTITLSDSTLAARFDPGAISSTATAGSSTTLTDSAQSLTPHSYKRGEIEITAGTGIGQKRTIADNNATQFTVTSAWTTTPDATSVYAARKHRRVLVKTSTYFSAQVLSVSGAVLTLDRMPVEPSANEYLELINYETFRVVSIRKYRRGGAPVADIECEHVSYDLNSEWVHDSAGRNKIDYVSATIAPSTALNTIFASSTWRAGWNELSDSDPRPLELSNDSVMSACRKVVEAWGCEVVFREDQSVDFLLQRGATSGLELRFAGNVERVARKTDARKRKNCNFTYGASTNWLNVGTGVYSLASAITKNTVTVPAADAKIYRVGDIITIAYGDSGGDDLVTGTFTDYDASTKIAEDTSQSLTTNAYLGGFLYFTSGNNEGLQRNISSNTATTMTLYRAPDDTDITGDTYFLAPKQYAGTVITAVNTGTGMLTFSWNGGNLPISPTGTVYVVLLVNLLGDLTVGKHPKYRTRCRIDSVNADNLNVLTGDGSKFTVADYVFVGTTDQRTGEGAYITGIAGDTLTLDHELSETPAQGDHVELHTVTQSALFIRRGIFTDSDQRDPYQLYQDSLRDLQDHLTAEVSYQDVRMLDIYEMDRDRFFDEKVEIGDTLTVRDADLGLAGASVRVKGMRLDPLAPYQSAISLETVTPSRARTIVTERRNTEKALRKATEPIRARCIHWSDDAGTCLLKNKDSSTDQGLFCLDPVQSREDGRSRADGTQIVSKDCPKFAAFDMLNVKADSYTQEVSVSGVNNANWDLSHRAAVDWSFRVQLDNSGAFLTGVIIETTGSAADLALADVRIQTVCQASFDAASGTLSVGTGVSWDGGSSVGQVYAVYYKDASTGWIKVHVYNGANPTDNDVITDTTNSVTLDGDSTEEVLPYNSDGTGCYVQVKRLSGTDSLQAIAVARLRGYAI